MAGHEHHHHHSNLHSREGLGRAVNLLLLAGRLALCPGDDLAVAAITILPPATPLGAITDQRVAAFRDPSGPVVEINGVPIPIS